MELSGTIKEIFEEKQISARFRKRELVLTTEDRYPQHILVEFTQDKTELLDQVQVGDRVTIAINIRGREWTSPRGEVKYFTSIQGWKIGAERAAAAGGPDPRDDVSFGEPPPGFDDVPLPDSPNDGGAVRDDDIPF